jgi:hypothetical protein
MHPMLLRQLRRSLGVDGAAGLATLPGLEADPALLDALGRLVAMVSDSYQQFDRDLALRTRSLDLSSQELTQANDRLREEAVAQRAVRLERFARGLVRRVRSGRSDG